MDRHGKHGKLNGNATWAKRTSEFLFLVICFVMLTSPVLAYPRKRPPPTKLNNITEITVPRCRPVDPDHLRYRMGRHYDESRMAMDEEDMKRSTLRERSIEDDDDFENDDDDEFDDSVDDFDSNIDSISNTMMSDGGYGNSQDRTVQTQDSAYLDSMKFMRKRKRRAVVEEEEEDDDDDDFDEDVTFYQRLMQLNVRHKRAGPRSGRRRKQKQKLKRKDHLSWKCKMKKIWNKTKPGYFPKYYNSVECLTKLCYYKLNECVEQGYTINLFKMDPNRCNPVPTVGVNTTYEEVWVFEKLHVNVWCECGNPKNKRKRKNRRRRPRDV
ncbi:uncharacterized protein LOC110445202 isoform X2 [Mizuhopecten yessoensis]|uniref:uncharacterized protein LOC110445202 isoform X2 n=1 Tax=Mizuhopecten yessoensis TaxID=6573 RepID=UPI000B45EEBD|nr:uncharacterized protein LOC110445202 isoform X2 [Mizuhopecten yessoensis]